SYLDFLENRNVSFDDSLRDRFVNDDFKLSKLLTLDFTERRSLNLDYQSYYDYKKAKIHEYFSGHSFNDYVQFFDSCISIKNSINQKDKSFQLLNGIRDVLLPEFCTE
ncbi:MAG: hypothetical protein JSV83_10460, partial [Desulfobacterales bacterium]